MADFAGDGGMIPEQVWDADDIPEKGLYRGRATGSASPLAWAHAEYLKLLRSLAEGSVFDLPPQTVGRYLEDETHSDRVIWRPDMLLDRIASARASTSRPAAPGTVRWSSEPVRAQGRIFPGTKEGLLLHARVRPAA